MTNKELIEKVEIHIRSLDPIMFSGLPEGIYYTDVYQLFNLNTNYASIKISGSHQCMRDRNRTITDLFRLALSIGYKKDLYSFYKELYDYTEKSKKFFYVICKDIDKRVYSIVSATGEFSGESFDEYRVDLREFNLPEKTLNGYNSNGIIKNPIKI